MLLSFLLLSSVPEALVRTYTELLPSNQLPARASCAAYCLKGLLRRRTVLFCRYGSRVAVSSCIGNSAISLGLPVLAALPTNVITHSLQGIWGTGLNISRVLE